MPGDPGEIPKATGPPIPFQLYGQRNALYQALTRKDSRLAGMYLGALLVLHQTENPERIPLAAHALRELMENLPKYLDLPVPKKPPSLKVKVMNLNQDWQHATKSSVCNANPLWSGAIDVPLQKFLERVNKFFEWFQTEHPMRRERTEKLLKALDPLSRRLPGPIGDLRIEEWVECFDYFVPIAHHAPVSTLEDFKAWLDVLERFLLDRLKPRTFEDLAKIKEIIEEGESDAEL